MVDTYEIYDKLADLPPRVRMEELDKLHLSEDDRNDVIALLGALDEGLFGENGDVFGSLVKSSVEGSFKPVKMVGLCVGHFRLTSFVAEGNFGYVFKAVRDDDRLEKQVVAVKVIKPHLANFYNYDLIDREANIMAKLGVHDAIVKVFDAGVIRYCNVRLPCYMMDYINGLAIDSYFKKRFSLSELIECFIELSDALVYAHENSDSVIHSDIKPTNILIDSMGRPRLLDFGIAQHARKPGVGLEAAREYAEVHSTDYSSPEFKEHGIVTTQSDIYSLGVILRQVVTGVLPPFDNAPLPSKRLYFLCDAKELKPWLAELDAIILAATHKDPKQRFARMRDFKHNLSLFLERKPVAVTEPSFAYSWFKFAFAYPVHAMLAIGGVSCVAIVLMVVVFFSGMYLQDLTDDEFQGALLDNYNALFDKSTPGKNGHLVKELVKRNFAVLSASDDVSKALLFKYAISNAELAGNNSMLKANVDLMKIAYDAAENEDDLLLASGLYAAALYRYDKSSVSRQYFETQAKDIAKPVFDYIKAHGFRRNDRLNKPLAKAFLALFDVADRLIFDEHEYIDWLYSLEYSYSSDLDNDDLALLYYHLATEKYWTGYGDNLSPSVGYSPEQFQNELLEPLNKALDYAEEGIVVAGENGMMLPQLYLIRARIEHELGFYHSAEFSLSRVDDLLEPTWGAKGRITTKVYQGMVSVYRFHDLLRTIEVLKQSLNASVEREDRMLSDYLLAKAYMDAGQFDKFQSIVARRAKLFDADIGSVKFKSLDSISALFTNYLEYTGFDADDALSRQVAASLINVNDMIVERYPDRIDEYEIELAKVYYGYFYGEYDDATRFIDDIFTLKGNVQHYSADDNYYVLLNFARMNMQLGNIEVTKSLVLLAYDIASFSTVEREGSVGKMRVYLIFAEFFKAFGEHALYAEAMQEAEKVFNKHYDVLKNSYYSDYFVNEPALS